MILHYSTGSLVLVDAAYTLAAFTIPAVQDIVYREIPPEYWVPVGLLGAALGVSAGMQVCTLHLLRASLLLGLMIAIVGGALFLVGLLGGGDVFALIFLAVSLPCPLRGGILPPVYEALFYAIIGETLYRVIVLWRACGPRCTLTIRGVPVKAYELLTERRFKWWVIHGVGVEDDGLDVELALAEEPGKQVQAAPGSPMVAFLLLGLILYLALGPCLARLLGVLLR